MVHLVKKETVGLVCVDIENAFVAVYRIVLIDKLIKISMQRNRQMG